MEIYKTKKSIVSIIPNTLTVLRIIGAVSLFFLEPLSIAFFVVFTLCGISDVFDGWIARAAKCESSIGSKLDSIADLMFYTAMIICIFPTLWIKLHKITWWYLGLILFIRVISYGTAAIKYRQFASIHTYLNKITGLGVFLIPYSLLVKIETPYCLAICTVAFLSATEELIIHLKQKKYNPQIKSIFLLKAKD